MWCAVIDSGSEQYSSSFCLWMNSLCVHLLLCTCNYVCLLRVQNGKLLTPYQWYEQIKELLPFEKIVKMEKDDSDTHWKENVPLKQFIMLSSADGARAKATTSCDNNIVIKLLEWESSRNA